MAETLYSKDHEWVRQENGFATVGITSYAADQLGDVVFVELPEIGRKVDAGAAVAVVESVKAASDVYAPLGGEIVEINSAIVDQPALVNENPQDAGWFFKLRYADAGSGGLMTEAQYKDYLESLK